MAGVSRADPDTPEVRLRAGTTSAGTASLRKYDKKTGHGGHAVSIVGYTPTYFIIRNSWGPSWGHKGFAYASYEYATDAFHEAYGIVV